MRVARDKEPKGEEVDRGGGYWSLRSLCGFPHQPEPELNLRSFRLAIHDDILCLFFDSDSETRKDFSIVNCRS